VPQLTKTIGIVKPCAHFLEQQTLFFHAFSPLLIVSKRGSKSWNTTHKKTARRFETTKLFWQEIPQAEA
jgi:hypothetical protein